VLATFLSLRFWTFSLLAFGLVGTCFHFFGLGGFVVTLVTALGMGAFSGFGATLAFRALANASTTSGSGSGDAVGRVGKVLVPLRKDTRGKVRVEVNGEMIDYLATTDDEELDAGAEVLVVEVRGESAHVARAPAVFRRDEND
jgi:membrane protein implicated in regulation of membrane protease activity